MSYCFWWQEHKEEEMSQCQIRIFKTITERKNPLYDDHIMHGIVKRDDAHHQNQPNQYHHWSAQQGAGLLGSQEVTSGIFRHIYSLLLLTFPLTIPPTFTPLPRSFPFWASPPSSICASNFLDLQRFEWFRVKQSFQFLLCFQISSLTLPSQMVLPVWSNSG